MNANTAPGGVMSADIYQNEGIIGYTAPGGVPAAGLDWNSCIIESKESS